MIGKLLNEINYPAFGLKEAPFQVKYGETDIRIIKHPGGKEYIFDQMIEDVDSYTERLFKIEDDTENRIQFDYTVLNREQLVFSYENIDWCVDQTGKIYNLQHKQNLPVQCRKVIKVKGDKIWLDKILAPFELKVPVEESNIDELWATIVGINKEWFVKSFSYEYIEYKNYYVV